MDKFNSWNAQKKQIETKKKQSQRFPKEAEVWVCSFGKNIGFEQDGIGDKFLRPALIIKKFNNHMYWVVPLSTKQKSLDFYYNFIDHNSLKVSVITAQLKLMSIKRFERKMYLMSDDLFIKIKESLKNFLL